MLDITFIRENPDIVRAALKNKSAGWRSEGVDLERLLALADERKKIAGEISDINRKRNEAQTAKASQGSSPDSSPREEFREAGKRLKDELKETEEKYQQAEKELVALLLQIPNIPSADTPVGPDESGNKVLREWGEKPQFSFAPKPHWELGDALGIIYSDTAAKVSGARFTYLAGDLALMQFALLDFALKTLTSQDTVRQVIQNAGLSVSDKPFILVVPPVMMHSSVMRRMARLDPIDDRFYFEKDDLVLIGSAEHTLGPIYMDTVLPEEEFPIRYVAYTPAFRREAGSYGRDTRGILRQHQFDKIEMESFTKPEDGFAEQDFLVAIQEHLLQQLRLPYQVVAVCTGDMGFPDQRQVDIETWMPGQLSHTASESLGCYRETHSADYIGGFQARRLNTRLKRANGEVEPVHMNDATAFAMGRTLIAILENNQQEDSSVLIPEVLRAYMGKDRISS